MLKHSFHARLSLWHIALLVAVLALSLPLLDTSTDRTLQQSRTQDTASLQTKS